MSAPVLAPTMAPPYITNLYFPSRRLTREVLVGDVGIGGTNPVRVQSMTTTTTKDVAATTAQAIRLVEAGCEIVRITAPTKSDAQAIGEVRTRLRALGIRVPLVADIHFSPAAAMEAVNHVEKVRVNPGNFADSRQFAVREYTGSEYQAELERIAARFTPLVLACKTRGVAMRIGTNHGSLSDRIMNRFGDSPLGMVESALEFVRICEANGYHALILSMKSSNPKVMIAAYRLLVARMGAAGMAYPLHLGVTEAGNGDDARIKSATGIGSLLLDGLGDTIRVSLAEEPEAEIPVARRLVELYSLPFPSMTVPSTGSTEGVPGSHRSEWNAPAPGTSHVPEVGVPNDPDGAYLPTPAWDPFVYARRASRPVRVGALQIGGAATIAVAGVVPGRDPMTLPVLNGGLRKAKRPDLLVLDVAEEANLEHLRHLAWKGDGPSPRPLVARSRDAVWLRQAAAHADGRCLVLDGAALAVGEWGDALALAESKQPLWLELDITSLGGGQHAAAIAALVRLGRDCVSAGQEELLIGVRAANATATVRAARLLAGGTAVAGLDAPIVLSAPPGNDAMLVGAVAVGSPLCDGIGDALQAQTVPLAFDLLQGAGARLTRTDYVACPSCGRTLFDLQSTTDRIKLHTSHLKGVKIAIMGCIVNGPGEMADADFGYMGGSPGHVNLYVGKEVVEKSVPEMEADERLIALIKAHGRWVEPGQGDDED